MWDNIETDLRILKQRCPNAPWLWERLEKESLAETIDQESAIS